MTSKPCLLALLLTISAQAATYCVREGPANNGDGSTWADAASPGAAGAFTNLPATLVRGATYYIADGAYGTGRDYTTAVDGTNAIYLTKATSGAHGTETGWDSGYGDGQATWTGEFHLQTSLWTIDGVTGSGLDATNYGFKIATANTGKTLHAVYLRNDSAAISNITIRHMDLSLPGYSFSDTNGSGHDVVYALSVSNARPVSGVTVEDCWIHKANRTGFFLGSNVKNWTIKGNGISEVYNSDQWGAHSVHGEAIVLWNPDSVNGGSFNHVIANNTFRNIEGSGWIMPNNTGVRTDSVQIYGNRFYCDVHHILDGLADGNEGAVPTLSDFGGTDGIVGSNGADVYSSIWFFNNTIVDAQGSAGFDMNPGGTNNSGVNNIWVNSAGVSFDNITTNLSNTTAGSTSLFIDYANHDYRLASALAGTELPADYATDPDNVTRGGDGTWDRGALEYSEGGDTTAPTVSSVTATPTSQTACTVAGSCDESALFTVEASEDTSWTNSVASAVRSTSFSLQLTSLKASTLYNYRVIATDAASNASTNAPATFTTLAPEVDPTATRTFHSRGVVHGAGAVHR